MSSDETERALLAERMLSEQEERRRVSELIHDGPVQQLSAISQMLDAGLADLESGELERAREVFARGLELARDAARDLRQLCDDLEPRVLDELGLASATAALARRLSARHDIEIEVDVEHADTIGENAAVALYQILREATEQAVKRGPLARIEIAVRPTQAGGSSSSSPTTDRRSAGPRSSKRSPSARERSTAGSARRCAIRGG